MLQPGNTSPWKALRMLSSPERRDQASQLPSTFKFTPSKTKKLYPTLNPPQPNGLLNSSPTRTSNAPSSALLESECDESYMVKDNHSFINDMDTLQKQLFSSNISNKVMNEFSSRYNKVREETIQAVQDITGSSTNEDLNRRHSRRFSLTHRNRFNRMESIAFHYAAKRNENLASINNKNNSSSPSKHSGTLTSRKLVPSKDNNEILDYNVVLTPGDKHFIAQNLESASKRLKVDDEEKIYKEVINSSPTKPLHEKQKLKQYYLDRDNQNEYHQIQQQIPVNSPSYLLPTKSSLKKSTSIPKLSPSNASTPLPPSRSSIKLSPSKSSIKISPSKSSTNLSPLKSTVRLLPSESTLMINNKAGEDYDMDGNDFKTPSVSPTRCNINSSPFSRISPSKAYSNLNKILSTPPASASSTSGSSNTKKPNDSSVLSSKSRLPRSMSSAPLPDSQLKKSELDFTSSKLISRSKTTHNTTLKVAPSTKSLIGSTSIPRLTKLVAAENSRSTSSSSISRSASNRHNFNNKDEVPKRWKY